MAVSVWPKSARIFFISIKGSGVFSSRFISQRKKTFALDKDGFIIQYGLSFSECLLWVFMKIIEEILQGGSHCMEFGQELNLRPRIYYEN